MELIDINFDNGCQVKVLENQEEILNSREFCKAITKLIKKALIKFLVVKRSEQYFIIFFRNYYDHDEIGGILINEGFDFVGAGFVENVEKLYFYSESCYSTFGYDRPENKDEQKVILENIEKVLKNLFEIFSE